MSLAIPAARSGPRKDIFVSLVVATVLTALSYIVGLHFGWENHLNWLEVASVFTSYACTWLCNVERRINYPIGALSTALLSILFWHQGLVASSVLNAYLTPSLLYGWIRWKRDEVTRPVHHISVKWIPAYLAIAAVGYVLALLIVHTLGGQLLALDAIVLVGSMIAQFMLDNKILENWWVWLVTDVVAIIDYLHAGLYLVAFQFVFFLINTVLAWTIWNRSMHNENICTDDRSATDSGPSTLDPIRI